MPDSLIVAATTLTVPATVPAFVVSVDRGSHSAPIATFTGERAKANAELFAAAPDLLAGCESARDTIAKLVVSGACSQLGAALLLEIDATLNQQVAAIAKAKGGQ